MEASWWYDWYGTWMWVGDVIRDGTWLWALCAMSVSRSGMRLGSGASRLLVVALMVAPARADPFTICEASNAEACKWTCNDYIGWDPDWCERFCGGTDGFHDQAGICEDGSANGGSKAIWIDVPDVPSQPIYGDLPVEVFEYNSQLEWM